MKTGQTLMSHCQTVPVHEKLPPPDHLCDNLSVVELNSFYRLSSSMCIGVREQCDEQSSSTSFSLWVFVLKLNHYGVQLSRGIVVMN